MKVRTLVVDDEPIARRTLCLLLARDPEVELVGACDAVAAIEVIPRERPDLLFLDIQMPELDGFGLLERVGVETVPAIVFVTAFEQHALRAFDVDAVDYLLKPFDDERFALALRRAKAALLRDGSAPADPAPGAVVAAAAIATAPSYLRRFVVRVGDRINLVRVADVDWVEAADYYARLHARKQTWLVRQSMGDLERDLDPAQFFRIHRSSIVNLDRIRELVPHFKGEYSVVMLDGTTLRMSRGRLDELQRRLRR